jgi:DNA-binding NarL/FixJ family response regulator
MEHPKVNIAIVDDHTLFRNGLAVLMNEFGELNVVFQAENGRHMQQLLQGQSLPDVILMDINMPFIDGYAATSWLASNYPSIKVLALSMYEDDKAVIGMIKCGARGYVLKEATPRELLEAIKMIYVKGIFINEMISGKLIRSVTTAEKETLSKKESEFIKLCCSELTYKEIADKMFVSPRTVDNYRESLFLKLNLKSRTGLVLYAIQYELFKF